MCSACAGKSGIPGFPAGEVTASEINKDPLAGEWRTEDVITLPSSDLVDIRFLRDAVKQSPLQIRIPTVPWVEDIGSRVRYRSFYSALISSMLEREFDIELRHVDKKDPLRYFYAMVLRPAGRDKPIGVELFPPFVCVKFGSVECGDKAGFSANLSNATVKWFFDNAVELHRDYPALFAQFSRALQRQVTIGALVMEPRRRSNC